MGRLFTETQVELSESVVISIFANLGTLVGVLVVFYRNYKKSLEKIVTANSEFYNSQIKLLENIVVNNNNFHQEQITVLRELYEKIIPDVKENKNRMYKVENKIETLEAVVGVIKK